MHLVKGKKSLSSMIGRQGLTVHNLIRMCLTCHALHDMRTVLTIHCNVFRRASAAVRSGNNHTALRLLFFVDEVDRLPDRIRTTAETARVLMIVLCKVVRTIHHRKGNYKEESFHPPKSCLRKISTLHHVILQARLRVEYSPRVSCLR